MRTGAAHGCIGHVHEAGFYSSDAEFLALIVPFVTGGIVAGEPVIIGYDDRKCDLLRAELTRPDRVSFAAEPPELNSAWERFAAVADAAPKLWMDAYLAAFAHASGARMVTFDGGFRQFRGLNLLLLA